MLMFAWPRDVKDNSDPRATEKGVPKEDKTAQKRTVWPCANKNEHRKNERGWKEKKETVQHWIPLLLQIFY